MSCTLNVLTVIMYEFKKEVPAEVYSMILENVLLLMSSAAREILKATVSFLITLTKEGFLSKFYRKIRSHVKYTVLSLKIYGPIKGNIRSAKIYSPNPDS